MVAQELKPMGSERRQSERYLTRNSAFAALRPDFTRVGRICDISASGIAFEYVSEETLQQDLAQIDIFITEKGFFLPRVPCRVVYESVVNGLNPGGGVQVRRCGLELGELSEAQKAQLEYFLRNHVVGKA